MGGTNGKQDLTEAQVVANACLVRYLEKEYSTINYVIGHKEYLKFRNTPLWQERDRNYFTYKVDPGDKFMREVREKLNCGNKNFICREQ